MRAWLALLALAGCDRVFGIGDPYEDARVSSSGSDAAIDSTAGHADVIQIPDASLASQAIVHFPFDSDLLDDQGRTTAFCATGTCNVVLGGHVGVGSLQLSSSGCAKFIPNAMPAQFTLAMWVYPNSSAQQTLISRQYAPASPHVIWNLAGSTASSIAFTSYNGNDTTMFSTLRLSQNIWQHFVVTYDGQTLMLYVNEQAAGMLAVNLSSAGTPEAVLGCDYGEVSGFFTGNIDDVFIYDRALSPAEIAVLYARAS